MTSANLLTLTTAALGATLLTVLATVVTRALRSRSLARFRSHGEGVADLLNYAALIDDGIVVGKDGSLMAAWRFRCADMASSTIAEQEHLAARLNAALQPLGGGWMLHVDAVRHCAQASVTSGAFPDGISRRIDEERRRFFDSRDTVYDGYCVLTVSYLPPALMQSKFVELMFHDDRPKTSARDFGEAILANFKQELAFLEARIPLQLTRLKTHTVRLDGRETQHDEMLRWLNFCVTGNRNPIAIPKTAPHLDLLIGGQELWSGTNPKIGKRFVNVVALEGFPLQSRPGMLAHLAQLRCEYRWSTRFICLDRDEALKQLEKYRDRWGQKIRGVWDELLKKQNPKIDKHAMSMVWDANDAIMETESGETRPGYFTSVVVLMHEDRAELTRATEAVYRAITEVGFSNARVETFNTMEAFLGSLPGHGVQNVRRPLVNTLNLADMLPTSTIWSGHSTAPCPYYPQPAPPVMECLTDGATPFRLNLHVGDVGHTLMFGPTGSGKSTHLALLLTQMRRYPKMRIYAFDKGYSLYTLASAIEATFPGNVPGARHYELSADGGLAFAPLQNLGNSRDRGWAAEWLELVLGLNGVEITPEQRNAIFDALQNMHHTGSGSLTEFVVTVQDSQIREALRSYTMDGTYGHLLDATEDDLSLSSFTVFEMAELMELGDRVVVPVLWYLLRQLQRSLDGSPTVVSMDEAWTYLGNPVIREKLRELLKELRKSNCLLLLATQHLSDAKKSGILDVLTDSCPTKIFLPNPDAAQPETLRLYRGMGLNDRQTSIIRSAQKKAQYYYASPEGHRLYELALGPTALAICGNSDLEGVREVKKLQARWGDAWVDRWLAHKTGAMEGVL